MTIHTDRRSRRPIARLTSVDRMYLHDESAAWPCHFGGLAVVEGRALLDESGRLRLADIRERLGRRLVRLPDLRQRLHVPGRLRGGPLWVDDDRFAIEYHVNETRVEPPGGDAELLATATRLYAGLLDRSRPLWEMWFLTGLRDDRVGVLLKLHHAVADGASAVAVMGSLFDPEPDAEDPRPAPWAPMQRPGDWLLFADNVARVGRSLRGAFAALAHPRRLAGMLRIAGVVLRRSLGQEGAPRTSLNPVVRAGRRVRFMRLDLDRMKEAGHEHGGTLNDVVLALWAGGLRGLLVSRGERVDGVELVSSVAVSTRTPTESGTIDNRVGTIVLRMPTWEPDPGRRLDLIVPRTREAKAKRQMPAEIMRILAAMAATPLGRYLNLHQRAVNVLLTNVVGPAVPMYVLGARIVDIVPIVQLVGNIGLTLCAFSYAGRVFLVVTADAEGFPDIDVLMDGMEREWQALRARPVAPPVASPVSA